jgi:hypothetical protein
VPDRPPEKLFMLNREARDEWSSRVNSTLAFTEVYFGQDYYNTLYALNTGFGDTFAKFNPISILQTGSEDST